MDSWLLDPDLMKMLPQGNIRRFVERFHLVSVEKGETFSMDGGYSARNGRRILPIFPYHQTADGHRRLSEGRGKLGTGYGIFLWKQKDA